MDYHLIHYKGPAVIGETCSSVPRLSEKKLIRTDKVGVKGLKYIHADMRQLQKVQMQKLLNILKEEMSVDRSLRIVQFDYFG